MSSYQDSENFKTCYVFKDVDDELATCLCSFWKDYHHEFWNNLQDFSTVLFAFSGQVGCAGPSNKQQCSNTMR